MHTSNVLFFADVLLKLSTFCETRPLCVYKECLIEMVPIIEGAKKAL